MERMIIAGGRVVTPAEAIPRGWVLVDGPKVAAIGSGDPPADLAAGAEIVDATGQTVSPGFIDLHVHGGGGGDPFAGTEDAIRAMTSFHLSHGTTAMLVTTGTLPEEQLADAIRLTAAVADAPDGAVIAGIHLEGPFIAKRFKGAQPECHIRPASVGELERLRSIRPDFIRLVTLAPEEPGALTAVDYLCRSGIVVAMGHSNATYAEAERAIDAGVRHATHTFSAMRPFHHREPGIVGAALLDDRVTAELIMDGIHVQPEAARLLVRMKRSERICLITDAVAAAGLPDGRSELFGAPIEIVAGTARLPDGTLAGSTLTMDRAVANMVALVGVPLTDAIRMASLNPARVLGLADRKGSLAIGKDADIVLLDDRLAATLTILAGRVVDRGPNHLLS